MSGLFGGNSTPPPPPPPEPPPTRDQAADKANAAQGGIRRGQGRASTDLTASQGDTSAAPVLKKTLGGQ